MLDQLCDLGMLGEIVTNGKVLRIALSIFVGEITEQGYSFTDAGKLKTVNLYIRLLS